MPRIRTMFQNDPDKIPFDFYEVLGAIAPRSVFVNAPLRDGNFDCDGVRKILAAIEPIYALHHVSNRVKAVHPDLEHSFPPDIRQAAYQWLEEQFGLAKPTE